VSLPGFDIGCAYGFGVFGLKEESIKVAAESGAPVVWSGALVKLIIMIKTICL
jgi:hypothetical protein